MNNMKKSLKASNGITLIALVITIIVLLILAGISISMLSGDNSILQKATTAKENTDNAQIKERIQLAYHSALAGGQGSYTNVSLEEELEKEFGGDYEVDDSDSINWKLKAKGQEIIIPAGKKEGRKVVIKIGTTNLKEILDLTTLYGEITDYTSVDGVKWQLFYDDDINIYLIASNYVPINTLPTELTKEEQEEGKTKYQACFANNVWDSSARKWLIAGQIMENKPWSEGTNSNILKGNAETTYLINNYLKWVNSDVADSIDSPNKKALVYMMDTTKWSNFAGNIKGAYAIGGPTIELFALSYNAKHDKKMGIYETIDNNNSNRYGYKVYLNRGYWYYTDEGLDINSNNMWVITENSKSGGMWLASPSASTDKLLEIYHNGVIGEGSCSATDFGFRPLICIPKSSLK